MPDLAARRAEMDEFDFVEGLVIKGGIEIEVLNGISLHGGLCQSWPGGVYLMFPLPEEKNSIYTGCYVFFVAML